MDCDDDEIIGFHVVFGEDVGVVGVVLGGAALERFDGGMHVTDEELEPGVHLERVRGDPLGELRRRFVISGAVLCGVAISDVEVDHRFLAIVDVNMELPFADVDEHAGNETVRMPDGGLISTTKTTDLTS